MLSHLGYPPAWVPDPPGSDATVLSSYTDGSIQVFCFPVEANTYSEAGKP